MYQQMIREELARTGRIGTDPRHVEAWMRLEHSTLDAMDARQFAREVKEAAKCCDTAEPGLSERLAESM